MSKADGHTKQNDKINWHPTTFFIPYADVLFHFSTPNTYK